MTKQKKIRAKWTFGFQLVQTASALAVLLLAIYAGFFSDFSQLIENNLRAELVNAELDLAELKKQRLKLAGEIESKSKALSILENQISAIRIEKDLYIASARKEYIREFKKRADNRIALIEDHLENAEKFEEFLTWANAAAYTPNDPKFIENRKNIPLQWTVHLLNLAFQKFAWVTQQMSPEEQAIKSLQLIENGFRNYLKFPMPSPSGRLIPNPPISGIRIIENAKSPRVIRYLRKDERELVLLEINQFLATNDAKLSKFINFTMEDAQSPTSEILKVSSERRQNLTEFKILYKELLTLLSTLKLN